MAKMRVRDLLQACRAGPWPMRENLCVGMHLPGLKITPLEPNLHTTYCGPEASQAGGPSRLCPQNKRTALMFACEYGHVDAVRALLTKHGYAGDDDDRLVNVPDKVRCHIRFELVECESWLSDM